VVSKSSKTEWKEGGQQSGTAARLLTKISQNVIFEVISEVQKDLEDISAKLEILPKNKVLNKFSCNLRSKLARSTLTSPGQIRVTMK
jgi:hypothetical protein